MSELTDPNPSLQANAAGDTYKPRTSFLGGGHLGHSLAADPADGSPIKPASQADVEAVRDRLPAGGTATEATAAAILAKILAAPATEAKQDTGNAALASILAKIIAAPATEATAAAILAKLIAAPSTEAKQDTIVTALAALLTELQSKTEPADTQTVALSGLEGTDNDDEDPAAGIALPVESYSMMFNPVTGKWHRIRGTKESGQLFYSDDLNATMLKLSGLMNAILSRLPPPNALKRLVVEVAANAALPANQSANIAQWAGQTAATGAGAAGNGAPRVTPSNDTLAGIPQIPAVLMSFTPRGFRNLVTT